MTAASSTLSRRGIGCPRTAPESTEHARFSWFLETAHRSGGRFRLQPPRRVPVLRALLRACRRGLWRVDSSANELRGIEESVCQHFYQCTAIPIYLRLDRDSAAHVLHRIERDQGTFQLVQPRADSGRQHAAGVPDQTATGLRCGEGRDDLFPLEPGIRGPADVARAFRFYDIPAAVSVVLFGQRTGESAHWVRGRDESFSRDVDFGHRPAGFPECHGRPTQWPLANRGLSVGFGRRIRRPSGLPAALPPCGPIRQVGLPGANGRQANCAWRAGELAGRPVLALQRIVDRCAAECVLFVSPEQAGVLVFGRHQRRFSSRQRPILDTTRVFSLLSWPLLTWSVLLVLGWERNEGAANYGELRCFLSAVLIVGLLIPRLWMFHGSIFFSHFWEMGEGAITELLSAMKSHP